MSNAAAFREETFVDQTARPPNREEVLARYFRLREIGKQHHNDVVKFLTKDAIVHHARRLGLLQGKTFVLDSMDELTLAADLAIHTAPPDRSRAIDRYARAANLARGSEDAAVLEAMRNARFAVVKVLQRHPSVGLIVTDLAREIELWLVDVSLEASLPDGAAFATRYCTPGAFAMTVGVAHPGGSRRARPSYLRRAATRTQAHGRGRPGPALRRSRLSRRHRGRDDGKDAIPRPAR